jgi:multiple sugar transport system substrate-binding protein
MQQLVEEFNAGQSDIAVTMNSVRWDDFYRKVPVAVASGKGPDVGVMHQHQLPTAAATGVVVPLDTLAEQFGLREQDFVPAAWQGGVFQGRRFGVPLDVHPLAMYYNRRAFEQAGLSEPPADADSFADALQRLRGSGFQHPFWMPTLWPAHFMFGTLVGQFGGGLFAPDASRVTFDSDAGRQAIRWMSGIAHSPNSPAAVALDSQWNAFQNGTNAVAWDGIWMLLNIKDVPGGAGVAPIPRIGTEQAVWANSHNLVIFGRPKLSADRVQAGMVFIDWLVQHSMRWAEAGQLPARNSVRESAEFRALPGQAVLARQLPYVRLLPTGPGVGNVHDDTLLYALDAALRSDDPDRELANAARLADDRLRTFRDQYRR